MAGPARLVGSTGMTERQVVSLLRQSARQIYWMGDLQGTPHLRTFLERQTPAVTANDFRDGYLQGKLRLAFGGICAEPVGYQLANIVDGRYDAFVADVVTGLKGTLGSVVFGGTYWSWMPALARAAVDTARVPIVGVMPQHGLADLAQVAEAVFSGPGAAPPMDYLAVVGKTYSSGQYSTFMASAADGLINIGGRAGALTEVLAMLQQDKPAFLAPVLLPPDRDWLMQKVHMGLVYPKDTTTLIEMIRNNFRPHAEGIFRPGLPRFEHLTPHEFRARHVRDYVLGVVSTSGSTTDINRLTKIAGPLLGGIQHGRLLPQRVIGLGGMTDLGGISVFYDVCLRARIDTAGIMCWQGASSRLARGAREMLIVGDNWSDESPTFLDLIDILLVLEPGQQGWHEALAAAQRNDPVSGQVPVIVLKDPILARGRDYPEIPGAQVFTVEQLDQAILALNDAIDRVQRRREAI